MRVAVVGATGNVGSAVLDALAGTPEVTEVVGIARRMPDSASPPYAGCAWESIDIAAASAEGEALARLTDAFAGADAVVHLAWLIQPNSDRDLLRRVNVEGTRRVTEAVARAGVPHLVVASSVGAYSPDDTDASSVRRDEEWPTAGIPTSHYSVDKAAQERVLDEFSAHHPDTVVTRLRTALVFGGRAASEIQRYFLGSWMPLELLQHGRPPFLPVPRGLRGLQAVHSDDVGRAYAAAVLARVPGPFNICADDTMGLRDLADVVDHGRYVEVPARLLRTGLGLGHRTGLVAADEGWIDMAMTVPLMDTARAKAELGWEPRTSAANALRDLLDGFAAGTGTDSVPLRAREPSVTALGVDAAGGAPAAGTPASGPSPTTMTQQARELLGIYLDDHLSGATAGAQRIARMAEDFIDTPFYAPLSELSLDIERERARLAALVAALDLPRRRLRQAVSWAGERVGRLKGNGAVVSRSPLTPLLETELMRSAIIGKLGLWQTLTANAEVWGLAPDEFDDLVDVAHRQLETLDAVHAHLRTRALRTDGLVFDHHSADSPVRAEPERKSEMDAQEATPMPHDGRSADAPEPTDIPEAAPHDAAERPGTSQSSHDHDDELADEWGRESFPGSDPPAHY